MKNNSRLKTQTQNSDSKLHSGLTLIELIVTVSILVIALTITGSLLVSIIKAQTRTNASRTVQQEARNVMETITREAKLVAGSKDHAALIIGDDIDAPQASGNELHLINIDGAGNEAEKIFKLEGNKITLDGTDITSGQVNVTNLTFETSSDCIVNPPSLPNIQPFVTITLTLSRRVYSEDIQITLKTTVSSRDYKYDQ